MKLGRLHVLTDFFFQQQYTHYELARLALEGGADTVQFRQKQGTIRQKLHEARPAAEVCDHFSVPLIVNDHIDIAMAINAKGVHLGPSDFPLDEARRILGTDYIIGATANSMREAKIAARYPIDYLGFGPVYTSASKLKPAPLQGLDALHDVCATIPIPVIAISGITVERVSEVMQAGAYGVAVMTAISTALDPKEATNAFRQEIDHFVSEKT